MPDQPIQHTDFMDQDYWSLAQSLCQVAQAETEALGAQLDESLRNHADELTDGKQDRHDELLDAIKQLTTTLDRNLARIADHLYEISRPR
jgi:hypothetical protein